MSGYVTKRSVPIDTAWRPELAYVVGLIATDGCLYNDRRHINLTSKDLQLIRTFKKCLGLRNKEGKKNSGFADTWAYNLQFGSVDFYNFLLDIGLTPAKSKTMSEIKIPKEYFPDFLRGLFDGDGTIYSYMDPRWASSHMFYTAFVSASKLFIDWLQKQGNGILGINGRISISRKVEGNTVYQLKYAKKESLVLIGHMYYNHKVPCLKRKRDKIRKILKKHNYFINKLDKRTFLKKSLII